MPRYRRERPWQAFAVLGLVVMALGAASAWPDIRLDREHRTADGRLIERQRGRKGGPYGVYGYRVAGVDYMVNGSLTDDSTPSVDYLPKDPGVARLQRDAGNGLGIGEGSGLMGLVSFVAAFGTWYGKRQERTRPEGRRLDDSRAKSERKI